MRTIRNILVGTFFILMLGLFHGSIVTAEHYNPISADEVKVMTYNLYLLRQRSVDPGWQV